MKIKKCKRGHEMTEENTYKASNGSKSCNQCRREMRKAKVEYYGPRPSAKELEILKKVVGV